jgi:hypothetical protein
MMTEPLFDIAVGVAPFFAGVLGLLIGIGGDHHRAGAGSRLRN